MYPHSLPPEALVMHRRAHTPHTCGLLCRMSAPGRCASSAAPPWTWRHRQHSAQRPPAEPVSLSPAAAGRKPMHLLTPELEIWTLPCGLRAVFDSYREMVSLDTEAP